MFASVENGRDDDLISSIAADVMSCLASRHFFEKLDGLLSPEDHSRPAERCSGTYKLSESILLRSGFSRGDVDDVFAVLQSKGACCDCEILYNVAESSRLKSQYWRRRAERVGTPARHSDG